MSKIRLTLIFIDMLITGVVDNVVSLSNWKHSGTRLISKVIIRGFYTDKVMLDMVAIVTVVVGMQ